MNFGNNLKAKRLEKGMTQEVLANKLGFEQSRISRYENSNREPCLEDVKQLAEVLGVTVDQLIADSEETEEPR